MTDIVERLSQIANAKTGDPLPDFLSAPGAWGEPLSALARDAIAEIMRLRTAIEQMQAVNGQTFAQIRDNLRPRPAP